MVPTSHRAGFKLIELAVVVAIVALVAGTLIPVVTGQVAAAKQNRAVGDMDVLTKAFTTFRTHTSIWPYFNRTPVAVADMTSGNEELTNFPCFYANEHKLKNWKGPYLSQGVSVSGVMQVATSASSRGAGDGLLDPWGQPYRVYTFAQSAGSGGTIALLCRGPDGVVNTSSTDVNAGAAGGDDLVKIVSRKL